MRHLILAASIVLAALVGRPGPSNVAEACNCIRSSFELVSTHARGLAPVNRPLQVAFARAWRTPVRIAVRTHSGVVIQTDQQSRGECGRQWVTATPRTRLAPGVRYEVIAVEMGVRPVATVVGTFIATAAAPITASDSLEHRVRCPQPRKRTVRSRKARQY